MSAARQLSLLDEQWVSEPPDERRKRELQAATAKADAIQTVERNADPDWLERAAAAVEWLAERSVFIHTGNMPPETGGHVAVRIPFSADDVWQLLGGVEHGLTPSALGPVFLNAARKGIIRKTGRTVPTRFARRHRDLTEWEGV